MGRKFACGLRLRVMNNYLFSVDTRDDTLIIATEEKDKNPLNVNMGKKRTHLPRKKAKYTIGVKALTNLRMNVLKMSRSSKLLSVFGTSKKRVPKVRWPPVQNRREWPDFQFQNSLEI